MVPCRVSVRVCLVGISVLLVIGCATGPPRYSYPGPAGGLTPEQIRQMPLLERPDRPGHVLGNSIRRIYRWCSGREDEPQYGLHCPDPCPSYMMPVVPADPCTACPTSPVLCPPAS